MLRENGNKTEVVIAAAARTPIGSFLGSLAGHQAHQLGGIAVAEALKRAKTTAEEVDEVIMGQVLTAACGQNPARQTLLQAGIPQERTAVTINQVCGSGLRAVAMAAQSIECGDCRVAVAGGQESMSNAPHAANLRGGVKMGDCKFTDTMIKDGLWCAANGYHMGVTAENVAEKWQITRKEQDEFAAASQSRAEKALAEGAFDDEVMPVTVKKRKEEITFDKDEYPRPGTDEATLAKLRPAFDKEGTVTAGNASGLNDGAAALVLMSAAEAEKRGINPLARLVAWATTGVDPKLMGIGPVSASKSALKKAGWKPDDLDLIEANEAFAAQSCAVNKEMGWDLAKVNVNGGAIALGHPIGASGARVLTTLLYAMAKRKAKKGLATLCIGGGMGIAACVERDGG